MTGVFQYEKIVRFLMGFSHLMLFIICNGKYFRLRGYPYFNSNLSVSAQNVKIKLNHRKQDALVLSLV